VQEQVLVMKVDNALAKHCVLDPHIMRASGGSIVIEALQLRPRPMYRVHWAGFHTSAGPEDCGANADLMLSRTQMVRMISEGNGQAITSSRAFWDPWLLSQNPRVARYLAGRWFDRGLMQRRRIRNTMSRGVSRLTPTAMRTADINAESTTRDGRRHGPSFYGQCVEPQSTFRLRATPTFDSIGL
jgi:hypothetical protein